MDLSRVGQGDRRGTDGHGRPTAEPAKAHAEEENGIEESKSLEAAPWPRPFKGIAVSEASHRTKDACRLGPIPRRVARRA